MSVLRNVNQDILKHKLSVMELNGSTRQKQLQKHTNHGIINVLFVKKIVRDVQ